jgi:DNA/RNA-binding domain of Phe-tRNA-synthetase-like protein
VNAAVDVCNWCSVEFQLPYGLYDADRIAGDVVLRLGGPGEAYAGIRKDVVHVEGRLTLADEEGPFGNPTSDSARTRITPETRSVLVAIFCPRRAAAGRLDSVLVETIARMTRYLEPAVVSRFLV